MSRLRTKIFGLGEAVTEEDAKIAGSRLPTARQILRSMIFNVEDGFMQNRTKYEAAKMVYVQITPFYEKGGIPMLAEQTCCQKIIKLLEENEKLRKIPKARRTSASVLAKLNDYEVYLSKTFPLWLKNAERLISNPEDKAFLKSMMTDRRATIAGFDAVSFAQVKRKEKRILSAEKRQKYSEKQTQKQFSTVALCDSDDSTSEDDQALASFVPKGKPKSHKRNWRTGTEAFIPHDIMKSPKLVSLAARMKMTPAQQASFTKAFVDEVGGDSTRVSTSYSLADKLRRQVSQEVAQEVRESWVAPKFASIHWDSKNLPSLCDKYQQEERLAIAVGDSRELKVLGIPAYKTGTNEQAGKIISRLCSDLLTKWQCSDSIVNMVFDTTSSNTGHLTAACISVQNRLDRALLWSGCLHHVGEIVVSHIFEALKIEASKSPETSVFMRLRKNWSLIPHDSDQPLSTLDITSFPVATLDLIQNLKDDVVQLAQSKYEFIRDDYKELMNLCIAYVSPGLQKVKFYRPGATHKARWMAKLIHSYKLVLLENQIANLPKGTITSLSQTTKLKDLINFISLVYCTYWFRCSVAVDAPWNCLTTYKNILRYGAVHKLISDTAERSFKRHLWYLTAEMVPLALFSSEVQDEEKRQMADKLIHVKPTGPVLTPANRFGTGYGKPRFPTEINVESKLTDFLTKDSWFFFSILDINDDFLPLPVDKWPESESYQKAVYNVGSINVTNDVAERGVKLSTEYLQSAKNEEHYQNTLQIVETNRKDMPNLRKRKK